MHDIGTHEENRFDELTARNMVSAIRGLIGSTKHIRMLLILR